MEKLKASANPMPCQMDWSLTKAIIIIIKQKMLTDTVKAFLSVKYCLIHSVLSGFYTRLADGDRNYQGDTRLYFWLRQNPKNFRPMLESLAWPAQPAICVVNLTAPDAMEKVKNSQRFLKRKRTRLSNHFCNLTSLTQGRFCERVN